jgi:polygalacturonase
VVPAGEFSTGAIHLKSNVNLHVSAGATLRFNPDPALYPIVFTRWEGVECMNFSPLIYAFEQENIAVTGSGTLDGGKILLWVSLWQQILWAASAHDVVPDEGPRHTITPHGDIIEFAHRWLPNAADPAQQRFIGRLRQRRSAHPVEAPRQPRPLAAPRRGLGGLHPVRRPGDGRV